MKIMKRQKGFTIIELMIATTVFSVVLLVCLGALVYVGRLYYKGITLTQTQSAARDAADSIADSVRFARERVEPVTASATDEWSGHVCVGSRKYSYKLYQVLVDDTPGPNQTTQALVESIDPLCDIGSPDSAPRTEPDIVDKYPPREILGEFMQLNRFAISEPDIDTGLVDIDISIAYGGDGSSSDGELFNYVTGSSGEIASCKTGVAGAQFCAISNLSKTVRGVQ